MKKYFYYLMIFLIIGVSMQSCKEDKNAPANETIASQNANQSASWNQVEQQLKALDMSYGLTKNIRRSPSIPGGIEEVPNYTDWELTDMGFSWGVAAADADGACTGIGAGLGLGGAIGSAIPAIGTSVCAVIGGTLGGIVVGAIFSINAYKEENGTQVVIDPNNPFIQISIPTGNRFAYGDNAPIGSEMGDLHNNLVNELLQDANFMALDSKEEMFEYIRTASLTTLTAYFTSEQVAEVLSYLADYQTTLDWSSPMESADYSMELNVIKHYAYEVSQALEPYDWLNYTRDYMMVVDNAYQNNLISEGSALMINGTISTLYCSKTAWNYIQPDPVFTDKYIIHSNDSWILTNNHEHLMLSLTSEYVDFVGYPYIENDTIKRIYVHTESPYNMMFPDSEVLPYLYEDGIFTNTTNTIQCLDNNLTCQPIAIGSYPIHSAVGYDNYVYIDLEQYID